MDMPPRQFYSLVTSSKKVRLLDVRTPQEYVGEHLSGALNIPVGDTVAFLASVDSLPRKTPFAVYCRSGRRSEQACALLARQGYTVYNLDGGIEAWKAEGLPTKGTDVPVADREEDSLQDDSWSLHGQLEDIHIERRKK